MTNEELAIQIQQGNNKYYDELWERVNRLVYKLLSKHLTYITLPNYISKEDLQQEMYFAFCKAVKAYDNNKPFAFNSYLDYHIRNIIWEILGRQKIIETSYNQIAGEDENIELIDLMPDPAAELRLQEIEITDLQRIVREAVARLPYYEGKVIYLHYLKGLRYNKINEILGLNYPMSKKHKTKGLLLLSKDKSIRGLYREFIYHYNATEKQNKYVNYGKVLIR